MNNMQAVKRLNNRYEVLRELGDGGFGKTFLARDCQMPSTRECVLKQLKPLHNDAQMYEMVKTRFQREAAMLEQLGEHDQIPRLYAYFSEDDLFYVVEEYVQGNTLTQKVHREGPQSEANVRSMLINLLPAIVHVHQQKIVHRDIKPDNIILRAADGKPVLIDFGAVKETMGTVMNAQGNSTHSIVVGTPGYMPSEQMVGRPVYASDLYSLGLTAIYMLTGKAPQELDSDPATGAILWRGFAPNVNRDFADFLDRAIQMTPQTRFSSGQEMFIALNALAVGMVMPPSGNQNFQHSATVMSNAPTGTHSAMPTQAVMPPSYGNAPVQQNVSQIMPPQKAGMSDWAKAMLMGGLLGVFVLGGLFITKSPQAASGPDSPKNELKAPQNSVPTPPQVVASPAPQPASSPQAPTQIVVAAPPAVTPKLPVEVPIPATSQAADSISEPEVRSLIDSWFQAKRLMFGKGYSYEAANAVSTGVLLNDITKPNGSIDWLKSNNAEYQFGVQKIDSISRIVSNGDDATVEIQATEDRTLYRDGRVDPTQTDFKSKTTVYTLKRSGSRWKIADYKNI
jgi:serine/threonine protein kinase